MRIREGGTRFSVGVDQAIVTLMLECGGCDVVSFTLLGAILILRCYFERRSFYAYFKLACGTASNSMRIT
jgi:hypothetical protein